jgi:hypothetical protein
MLLMNPITRIMINSPNLTTVPLPPAKGEASAGIAPTRLSDFVPEDGRRVKTGENLKPPMGRIRRPLRGQADQIPSFFLTRRRNLANMEGGRQVIMFPSESKS